MTPALLNRDISWLQFNHRVLREAASDDVPLMERFRFLGIYVSNLDEFYRVRMPALQSAQDIMDTDGVPVENDAELLQEVQALVLQQMADFGAVLSEQLLPRARQQGLNICYEAPLPAWLVAASKVFFFDRVLPYLQPVILQPGSRSFFPENNQLYLLVHLRDDREMLHLAVLNIPARFSGRFFSLPHEGETVICFVDDILRAHLPVVFRQYRVEGAYSFKITRDANMYITGERADTLPYLIEKGIRKRDLGYATRFLYDPALPAAHVRFVQQLWGLRQLSLVKGGRYHNLRDLAQLPVPADPRWHYPVFHPVIPDVFAGQASLFDTADDQDLGLHCPYQSYYPILRFFSEAAVDPSVEQVYVTLYRIADDSRIANALISAALNGKQVKVFVELKARFDEDNNLQWSRKMKAAGVEILYSIPGWKVHAKVAMVRRRVNGLARYTALLATGNFNENTARYYTDHALLTSDKAITRELELLFAGLQSRTSPSLWPVQTFHHLLVAPFNLQPTFLKLIDHEIAEAKAGRPARIDLKMNNLEDPVMIGKLYEAAEAGVQVEAVVRAICRLVPGVEGLSSRITVRRIVDRFLEHGRIFRFHHGGQPLYFMGSADWMRRNLYKRIEVCFPVTSKAIQRDLDAQLDIMMSPHPNTVLLGVRGENIPVAGSEGEPGSAQQHIARYFQQQHHTS